LQQQRQQQLYGHGDARRLAAAFNRIIGEKFSSRVCFVFRYSVTQLARTLGGLVHGTASSWLFRVVLLGAAAGVMTSQSNSGLWRHGYGVVVTATAVFVALAGANRNASTPGTMSYNNNNIATTTTTTTTTIITRALGERKSPTRRMQIRTSDPTDFQNLAGTSFPKIIDLL